MDDTVEKRLVRVRKLIQEAHDAAAGIPIDAAHEHSKITASALRTAILPGLDLLSLTIGGLLKDGQPKPFGDGLV